MIKLSKASKPTGNRGSERFWKRIPEAAGEDRFSRPADSKHSSPLSGVPKAEFTRFWGWMRKDLE
jgi:hypothetical protein